MNEIVSIDSMIFVWGVKDQCTEGQESMKEKAKIFLKNCQEEGKILLIPTPVIAEILRPVDKSSTEYARIIQVINERFRVIPFDMVAAVKCAEILRQKLNDEEIKAMLDSNELNKKKIKFDSMIVGIACTRKVSCLYSEDRGLRKLAEGYVNSEPLPVITVQTEIDFYLDQSTRAKK